MILLLLLLLLFIYFISSLTRACTRGELDTSSASNPTTAIREIPLQQPLTSSAQTGDHTQRKKDVSIGIRPLCVVCFPSLDLSSSAETARSRRASSRAIPKQH